MTMDDKKTSKSYQKFCCEKCKYDTSRQSQYATHLLTAKHTRMTNDDNFLPNPSAHTCCCGKTYKYRQGLHKHTLKCSQKSSFETNVSVNDDVFVNTFEEPLQNTMVPFLDNTTVLELIKQNQEFKELLIEQNKKLMEYASEPKTVTNSNNNNQQFNLQFFLNETCKDAITMDQFVKSIKITNGDIENVGNQGYVQGFTDIILKQLRTLDITKRPMHCTDVKRETIYIKDTDKWNKENNEKSKLKNAIGKVAHNTRAGVSTWYRTHPEVGVLDSNDYDMNQKIVRNTWGDGDADVLQEKVIKNIVKEVQVSK